MFDVRSNSSFATNNPSLTSVPPNESIRSILRFAAAKSVVNGWVSRAFESKSTMPARSPSISAPTTRFAPVSRRSFGSFVFIDPDESRMNIASTSVWFVAPSPRPDGNGVSKVASHCGTLNTTNVEKSVVAVTVSFSASTVDANRSNVPLVSLNV